MYYGDIHGGGRRAAVATDLYRHVPRELTEATRVGVAMSFLAVAIMTILVACETRAFLTTTIDSSLVIDRYDDDDDGGGGQLRLNFNVTLYDVRCDFVYVDVWDTLGTNLLNVTKDVTKWTIDDSGATRGFHGRNVVEREVRHEPHRRRRRRPDDANDGEEEDAAGGGGGGVRSAAVVDLTPANMKEFKDSHDFAVVDYYAPWCVWCQRLAPTWEDFAAEAGKSPSSSGGGAGDDSASVGEGGWLGVGKVDCVEQRRACADERIMAFPTIRWYESGRAVVPDYGGDRTVEALMEYARGRRRRRRRSDDDDYDGEEEEHHPGCMVHGHLSINRVPGNMVVGARSVNHEINTMMTNLTHGVNHLSFGPVDDDGVGGGPRGRGHSSGYHAIPEKYTHTDPMRGKHFPTYRPHEAYHHHMKLIGTRIDRRSVIYQILQESQLALYNAESIPEIKFLWDISPMSMRLSREVRPWYEYVTNLLAIVGGAYTTLGLINATLLRIIKPKRL